MNKLPIGVKLNKYYNRNEHPEFIPLIWNKEQTMCCMPIWIELNASSVSLQTLISWAHSFDNELIYE